MWRKGSRLPNDQRLAADQKNYATLETTETGEYIVIKPWGASWLNFAPLPWKA